MADCPPRVFQSKHHPPVALDLLHMLALVAQQELVVLVAWQDVDGAPEAGPAVEATEAHVPGKQAGGGSDGHTGVTSPEPSVARQADVANVPVAYRIFPVLVSYANLPAYLRCVFIPFDAALKTPVVAAC